MRGACIDLFSIALLFCSGQAVAQAAEGSTPLSATVNIWADGFYNTTGGTSTGGATLGKFETILDYSSPSTAFSAKLDFGAMGGTKLSGDLVGDTQGVNNIESVDAVRVFNAWISYQAQTASIGILTKVGIIDLNSIFDTNDISSVFINSSHGIGAEFSHSGLNGPSIYPNSGFGVVLQFSELDADQDTAFNFGIFDSVPNDPDNPEDLQFDPIFGRGALIVAEVDQKFGVDSKLTVGAWAYTNSLQRIDRPPTDQGSFGSLGAYATIQSTLVKGTSNRATMSGWIRAGVANSSYNQIAQYVGAGIVFSEIPSLARDDKFGVAVANAFVSRSYATNTAGVETNIELTYQHSFEKLGGLQIQPDIQFVIDPGGIGEWENALVVGLRIFKSFTY